MERAPLVYSLAMIEFAPVPRMDDFSESIMEALRSDYPDIDDFNTPSLKIEVDSATGETKAEHRIVTQWRMNNTEGDFGLVFGKERLVFHTTTYKTFEKFAEKIKPVIETLFSIASIKFTKNIGIRHIDNIVPIDGYAIRDLIKSGFLCPQQTELISDSSRVEFVYRSSIGNLFLRCYELEDHPKVPQDLFPVASQLSPSYSLMQPIKQKFVLVDTDHIHIPEKLEPVENVDNIIDTLDKLHKQNSLGFRSMVEDQAIEIWRKDK